MTNLSANTSQVFYKNFIGRKEIFDKYGNKTGTYEDVYGQLKSVWLCVSPNRGTAESEMFGALIEYDRVMTTSAVTCNDINENSILWLDGVLPSQPHNYVVKRRSKWKNSISFAIQAVEVSSAKQED